MGRRNVRDGVNTPFRFNNAPCHANEGSPKEFVGSACREDAIKPNVEQCRVGGLNLLESFRSQRTEFGFDQAQQGFCLAALLATLFTALFAALFADYFAELLAAFQRHSFETHDIGHLGSLLKSDQLVA